jgi:hypothetical protein
MENLLISDQKQLNELNQSYTAVTGKEALHFVCPITQRDEAVELCEGHILNKALSVSEATVIQRKDVDNHYGHTIEPPMIARINAEEAARIAPETMSKLASGLVVMTVDGSQSSKASFVKNKKQQENLLRQGRQLVRLTDPATGQINEQFPPLLLEQWMNFPNGEPIIFRITSRPIYDNTVEGALLKAAYLTLFRMCRYEVLNFGSLAGVRHALADFYNTSGTASEAHEYFGRFTGCVTFADLGQSFPDSLNHDVLLYHYATNPRTQPIAQSVVFKMLSNEFTMVTMPLSCTEEGLEYYQRPLARERV